MVAFFLMLICSIRTLSAQDKKAEVLKVVDRFFTTLEQNDSIAFRALFLPGAVNYYVQQKGDSILNGIQIPTGVFFKQGRSIKERFRPASMDVQVSNNIAMVWGKYDLWVNDTFSHCGTDVFTLLKTSRGWQIASLSFSIEKEDCSQ